ncbi:hypothetical protein MPNT_50096 [Candidatus Methylacidithermus pantelleriae]|uniref:Uncharacterized protein n=1 Tax=Candidatus Methylacidithermus pantelleriae TaxID=2744239 RepID=A0A8J2FT40_9BACT|nr:hypothetical protein MPNT_50096 [Candidatus Methylacidithermus pantelleriae]
MGKSIRMRFECVGQAADNLFTHRPETLFSNSLSFHYKGQKTQGREARVRIGFKQAPLQKSLWGRGS